MFMLKRAAGVLSQRDIPLDGPPAAEAAPAAGPSTRDDDQAADDDDAHATEASPRPRTPTA